MIDSPSFGYSSDSLLIAISLASVANLRADSTESEIFLYDVLQVRKRIIEKKKSFFGLNLENIDENESLPR